LAERIALRADYLVDYQDAAYADRYRRLVERVRAAEAPFGSEGLSEAVARYYFKLLAIKDEYEVARLHSDPKFARRISAMFEGDYRIHFHFAPPLIARPDPATGRIAKRAFGPWMMPVLRGLAALRGLRGSAFDIFGRTEERRTERALILGYEADIALLLEHLSAANLDAAIELASLPEEIRGFGHIKAATIARATERRDHLRRQISEPATALPEARAA
jgi:indolepyruvate ferredoxin oxidoreductase